MEPMVHVAYSAEVGHLFRSIPATCSSGFRSVRYLPLC